MFDFIPKLSDSELYLFFIGALGAGVVLYFGYGSWFGLDPRNYSE